MFWKVLFQAIRHTSCFSASPFVEAARWGSAYLPHKAAGKLNLLMIVMHVEILLWKALSIVIGQKWGFQLELASHSNTNEKLVSFLN